MALLPKLFASSAFIASRGTVLQTSVKTVEPLRLAHQHFNKFICPLWSNEYGSRSFATETDTEEYKTLLHPGMKRSTFGSAPIMHQPIYNPEDLDIKPCHRQPKNLRDRLALLLVNTARGSFDFATGYRHDRVMSEVHWLRRVMFLETVAGVPGMVAGMLRHLYSLRTLKRDHGWIHTLLEEAENERMHLMTFLEIKQAGPIFRFMVFCGQGVFFNMFMMAYILSPKSCHRFVGYLEEEAVKTYTHLLKDIDTQGSDVSKWAHLSAPEIAINYWQLAPTATLRDVVMVVRADEACHSHVNHTFSSLDTDGTNPFRPECSGPHGHEMPPTIDILKPVHEDFTQLPPKFEGHQQ